MAKPQTTQKSETPKPPPTQSVTLKALREMGLPDKDTFFRMKRVAGGNGWTVEVLHVTGLRMELNPWDALDAMARKCAGLVEEAERR